MNREAMKDYEKALEIADRIGDRMTSSIALTNIADILFEQHEFSRAEMLYSRALDICREIGTGKAREKTSAIWVSFLGKLGRKDQAREALRRSIALLEEIDAPARAVAPRINLAESFLSPWPQRSPSKR